MDREKDWGGGAEVLNILTPFGHSLTHFCICDKSDQFIVTTKREALATPCQIWKQCGQTVLWIANNDSMVSKVQQCKQSQTAKLTASNTRASKVIWKLGAIQKTQQEVRNYKNAAENIEGYDQSFLFLGGVSGSQKSQIFNLAMAVAGNDALG
eukprot:5892371-Amphidinium_carterae.1